MRIKHILSTLTLILASAGLSPVLATETAATPTSIAVVDVRALLTESDAAKSLQKQIKAERDAFLEQLGKEEKGLREQEKELVAEQGKLSAEEFDKKRKGFEEKLLETRKDAQTKKRDLEVAAGKATEKLRNEITKVVQKIADEKGYNLVISAQDVLIGAESLNITDEAMKGLNDAVSKISLDVK